MKSTLRTVTGLLATLIVAAAMFEIAPRLALMHPLLGILAGAVPIILLIHVIGYSARKAANALAIKKTIEKTGFYPSFAALLDLPIMPAVYALRIARFAREQDFGDEELLHLLRSYKEHTFLY